ncbi:MAG: N-acetylmuramoyl-L-alanine amidase [Saprospiraceae bacterium]
MLTTTIAAIQTIFCTLLPPSTAQFNISLETPTASVETPYYFGQQKLNAIAGTDEPTRRLVTQMASKVIKESQIAEADYRIKTIVLDPGHGGHDPGCLGSGSQEKHLALAIALKVRDLVTGQYPGIQVIMTRDADFFVPLHERAAIANRAGADLFISIHCNFMPGSSATKGTETYVMGLHTAEHNLEVAKRENAAILLEENYEQNYDFDPNSPEGHIMLSMFQNAHLEQSIFLAERVEAQFHTQARKSRGVRQAGFYVLKATTMPSILIESGFLSNREEETFLGTADGQSKIATAIVNAFNEYKAGMEYGATQPVAANEVPVPQTPTVNVPPPAKSTSNPVVNKPKTKSTETPVNTAPTTTAEEPKVVPISNVGNLSKTPIVQFCIQLAAASRPIDGAQYKWNGLPYVIEAVQEGNMYKYQVRGYTDLEMALRAKMDLKQLGFTDAFLVAYKNEERISIDQAKKELGIQY